MKIQNAEIRGIVNDIAASANPTYQASLKENEANIDLHDMADIMQYIVDAANEAGSYTSWHENLSLNDKRAFQRLYENALDIQNIMRAMNKLQ